MKFSLNPPADSPPLYSATIRGFFDGLPEESTTARLMHKATPGTFPEVGIRKALPGTGALPEPAKEGLARPRGRGEKLVRIREKSARALMLLLDQVREKERTRIARELHDQIGQMLTALRLETAWIERHYGADHPALADKTRDMAALVDASLDQVRALCADLRPALLDELGLVAAIEWETGQFQKRTGNACEFEHRGAFVPVGTRALAVFRILQEALTNVIRHAQATQVTVQLSAPRGAFELTIRDNGCGMAKAKLSANTSLGLTGMRERAEAAGCALHISSQPGKGTTIRLRLALPEGREG